MCTRVVTFNVLRARRACRLRDISTRRIDVHGLTWTRLPFYRPWDGSAHKSGVAQHGRHFGVGWGCEQTRFSNMFAGVSILVNKGSWKPRNVVRTCDAPPRLQGRAGVIRLRNWQEDITAIVMYWPPQPPDASSPATYAGTLFRLSRWLGKTLQNTPERSTPNIMTDLNDQMGVPWDDDENQA